MNDDADDAGADGEDVDVGDDDGVFFSLARAQASVLARKAARPSAAKAPPEAGSAKCGENISVG